MALSNSKKSANILLAIFIILTLLLSVGGYVLYRNQIKNITIKKHGELAAISKLKIDLIESWRKEHLEHARSIYNNQAIITHISEYVHDVDQNSNYQIITSWIKTILYEPDFSMVSLVDPSGKIIINSNPADPITAFDKRILEQAKLSQDIIFSDQLTYYDKTAFIDLAIPLYLNPEKYEGLSGVVFLRIDPEKFFYPLILNWPTPSPTSEILLVRRLGDSVLFISEFENKKNTAIHFHNPITDTLLLSSHVLAGKTGILEGIDYGGSKVLEDPHPVPGTPWFVIAKVDMDEVYQPIFALSIWIFIVVFLLILISAFNIYVVWTRLLNKSDRERKALLQHFEYVVKYANDIICLADLKGNIYEVNDKAVTTYGYTYDELIKLNIRQLRPIETRNTLEQQFQLLNEKDGYIYETIHINKNGEKFPVEVSGRIINIKEKKYIHLIIRDITERNLAIEKLRESEKELEHRVEERTAQLQTANQELEAFSYSVSHDLRAPLQNIDGWSMNLFEHCYDKIDVEGRRFLDQVRSETQRMGLLIEALLKLSRISRTELTKVKVDLTILARDITKRLLKETTNRQIEIILQPGMIAFGDPDMLEIVLTNLLNNAYKFTGKQPDAHIEFGQSVIEEKQTFWVRDNGAGFDMANAKNLFGAFQRMHKQCDFPGTGIGLATVQRIIHRHGGHIWADSKINQGTTFFFTI